MDLSTATDASHEVQAAIDAACARIAPTWPLDRFIAVNPYWGHVAQPIEHTAARLAVLAGSPMLMPRPWFREQWRAGRITRQDLQAAISAAGSRRSAEALAAALEHDAEAPPRLPLATDLADADRDLGHAMAWRDYVTQHISQCCAAYFDQGQAACGPERSGGLYACWLRQSAHDHAPALLMGYRGFGARLKALPVQPQGLIAAALAALRVPAVARADYLSALLFSINGWASWCAYRRWQARLQGADDDQIVHLLAVRLAWEWLLQQAHAGAWPTACTRPGACRRNASSVPPPRCRTTGCGRRRWSIPGRRRCAAAWRPARRLRHAKTPRPRCRRCSASTCAPRSIAVRSKRPARGACRRWASPASSPVHRLPAAGQRDGAPAAARAAGTGAVRRATCATTPALGQVLAAAAPAQPGRGGSSGRAFRRCRLDLLLRRDAAVLLYAAKLVEDSRSAAESAPRQSEQTGLPRGAARRSCGPASPPATVRTRQRRVAMAANALGAMGLTARPSRRWCCWPATAAPASTTRTRPAWTAAPAAARPARSTRACWPCC